MSGRNSAFLGLGGNIGDPAASMAAALKALDGSHDIAVEAVSSLYRTPPWGMTDQPDFLNAAARILTALSPPDLLARCLEVERFLKRVRRERWGPRLIDIDILSYGDLSFSGEGLEIPHPRLGDRAFVLVPLAEIAPDLRIAGRSVEDMLSRVDSSEITKASENGDWWKA